MTSNGNMEDGDRDQLLYPDDSVIHDDNQKQPQVITSPFKSISLRTFNVFLSVMTIVSNVAMNVTLPLFTESLQGYSDPYYVLFSSSFLFFLIFFIILALSKAFNRSVSFRLSAPMKYAILAGILNALNGLLVVYASDPSRTPPVLQAILSTSIIPFTVVSRYIITRVGVGIKRLVCTGVVLIGLFISMEPVIFNIDNADDTGAGGHQSTASRVIWPTIFLFGFLPAGIMNVLMEKIMEKESSAVKANVWVNGFQILTVGCLFWTDFIPGFGTVSSAKKFAENFSQGYRCQYGGDSNCSSVVGPSWLFVASSSFASVFGFLLLRYADGAIYLVIVQAMVTPLGALFWTVFSAEPHFHWHPVFDLATGFTIAGLVIMTPAVILYRQFGQKEEKSNETSIN
ncbi:uncharacterized protein LOC144439444 [Glandiceps talaboti]